MDPCLCLFSYLWWEFKVFHILSRSLHPCNLRPSPPFSISFKSNWSAYGNHSGSLLHMPIPSQSFLHHYILNSSNSCILSNILVLTVPCLLHNHLNILALVTPNLFSSVLYNFKILRHASRYVLITYPRSTTPLSQEALIPWNVYSFISSLFCVLNPE